MRLRVQESNSTFLKQFNVKNDFLIKNSRWLMGYFSNVFFIQFDYVKIGEKVGYYIYIAQNMKA